MTGRTDVEGLVFLLGIVAVLVVSKALDSAFRSLRSTLRRRS